MANNKQMFLEQITEIKGINFESWQGWEQLLDWVKHQTWSKDFFGAGKIPARLLHPGTLSDELSQYLGN